METQLSAIQIARNASRSAARNAYSDRASPSAFRVAVFTAKLHDEGVRGFRTGSRSL